MKIFHYHPITSEFLAETDAAASPLEPGVFLIPAYATTMVVPDVNPGHVAVFMVHSWVIMEDHRGKKAYKKEDCSEVVVDFIGVIPSNLTLLPPSEFSEWDEPSGGWVLDVPSACNFMEKKIKEREDEASWSPILFHGHLFKATQAVVQTNGRLKNLPGESPLPQIINGGAWDSLYDGDIPFTVQDLRDLEDAIYDRGAMNYQVMKAHNSAMRLSANPLAYDFSAGWY